MDAKKLYKDIKLGNQGYKEEIHCPMVLEVMNKEGTMTAFCKKALISDALFYKWTGKHPLFSECYQVGKVLSRSNWEEEGRKGVKRKTFNLDYWKLTGTHRYGVGKNRVRMGVNAESNPYEQYKQLVKQASEEEFNASEIKQLMESINVGIRAFESFELQNQVDQVKEDLNKMKVNDANNISPIKTITEKN